MSDWMVSHGFHHYRRTGEFAAITGNRGDWAWQVGYKGETGTEPTLAAAKAKVIEVVARRRAERRAEVD